MDATQKENGWPGGGGRGVDFETLGDLINIFLVRSLSDYE